MQRLFAGKDEVSCIPAWTWINNKAIATGV